MVNSRRILPQAALNMVPITRTPWGGKRIACIKAHLKSSWQNGGEGLAQGEAFPERVGESWEISTGNPFPSKLRDAYGAFPAGAKLEDVLEAEPWLLGETVSAKLGSHCPLLLKWLHAQEELSLQVHPALGDARLEPGKEGKPESWLVLECEPTAKLYLGFQKGFSKDQIIQAFLENRETEVLYAFTPQQYEYICVPPGCVHAIGPGVLLAEPQYALPGKEGVTLRVSDWGRRYNAHGERDPHGQPRETHFHKSLETIDWNLPRGDDLRAALCKVMENGRRFEPRPPTPFPVVMWNLPGDYVYHDLVPQCYSVATVWAGEMLLSTGLEEMKLRAGETAFVSPGRDPLAVRIKQTEPNSLPGAAFFSLRF